MQKELDQKIINSFFHGKNNKGPKIRFKNSEEIVKKYSNKNRTFFNRLLFFPWKNE